MQYTNLIPIGSTVQINSGLVKSRLPNNLSKDLKPNQIFKVDGYKITDGGGIGYIITSEVTKLWVFNSELSIQTLKEHSISNDEIQKLETIGIKGALNNLTASDRISIDLDGNKAMKHVINPINFVEWLIFTTKDIV